MIWLGLLLIAVIGLVLKQYQRGFGVAILITFVGFAVSLNLLNVDATVARHNISRAEAGRELDIGYLSELSDDAIPMIGRKFTDQSLPDELHQQLGAALVCYKWAHEYQEHPQEWQSFNVSSWQAERTYQSLAEELVDYTRFEREYMTGVRTPDGEFLPCYNYYPIPEEPPPPLPEEMEYNATPMYPAP